MTDEVKQDVVEQPQQTNETPSESTGAKLSPIEERARAEGWVPKDEWTGDPDQWRPAKEFLDRGELFKKIEDQNRTIKEFKRALEDLKAHHARVREVEYQRALAALKAQKKEALENNDADRVLKIEDQIEMVKEEQKKLQVAQEQVEPESSGEANPAFQSWVERNKWYYDDKAMKAFADQLGRELHQQGLSPTAILKEVETAVKAEFAHKFRNPNRDKPSPVETSVSKGQKKSDDFVLTDEERRVMDRFVRTGVLTKDEYIKQLKAIKGVE